MLDDTLLWLCSIASPIGEERALCDAVQARLAKLSLAGGIRRYGDSIVVPVTRVAGGPHVALVGHLDTVRTENGPARIEGDRCFGAGASDMKSGLAVMIALAETLELARLACSVTLVFYAREEGPFAENELGPVLERDPELSRVDLAVCMEPSDNKLHLGCVGSIHATVTFQGRTAHSARPWEGENAITAAAPFLARVGALRPVESVIDGLVYRSVTTVTQARDGGRGRNVVPDRFVVNVNHRFAPDRTLEEASAFVRGLVPAEGATVGAPGAAHVTVGAPGAAHVTVGAPGAAHVTVELTDLSPAARPNAGHTLVKALVAAGVRAVEPKQAWTDVARFAQLAAPVPAVNFGPGENAQAHQKNESTSLPLVHEGFAIVARWLASLGAPA